MTIIKDFKTASADGTVTLAEQIRVAGDATFLGNPVDIAFEPGEMMIYVAERANGGGRVLGFAMPSMSGNYMPTYNDLYSGASAVHLSSDTGMGGPTPPSPAVADRFFVSSNTQRVIATYNVQEDNSIMKQQFPNANMYADGIYYDKNSDILYQVNRTRNTVNKYIAAGATLDQGLMPLIHLSSVSEFSNGRGLTVGGNWLVVAQDANDENGNKNRLMVFDKKTLALKNKVDVPFNLWGVHAEESTLYTVEDNSNRIVVFEDFFNQLDREIPNPFEVSIDGLVRTHGITYDAKNDRMLLTDIGAASSPDDGAFVVINNFSIASSDGVISSTEQVRIEGDATFLGNPAGIAYDGQRSIVYIAERANSGGRVLGFNLPTTSGNTAPVYNDLHAGASAIYFSDGDEDNFESTVIRENFNAELLVDNTPRAINLKVYPNPASDNLTVELPELEFNETDERMIIIYNAFGKEVLQMDTNNLQQNINISSLSDGVYYIMVTQNGRLITKQFIKTNHF
ncbi:MAG: T9SS type A sorting domain-containing protein [Saprospiraceae bacterium]